MYNQRLYFLLTINKERREVNSRRELIIQSHVELKTTDISPNIDF